MNTLKSYESRKPRILTKVKHSKYECAEALHTNKMYWSKTFQELDNNSKTPVSTSEITFASMCYFVNVCTGVKFSLFPLNTNQNSQDISNCKSRFHNTHKTFLHYLYSVATSVCAPMMSVRNFRSG